MNSSPAPCTPSELAETCGQLLEFYHPALTDAGKTDWRQAAATAFYRAGTQRHEHFYLGEIIGDFVKTAKPGDPEHGVLEQGLLDIPADIIDRVAWYYETAIALHPLFSEPHYNLATLYKRQGRIDDAFRFFLIAAELVAHPRVASNAFFTANAYWEAAIIERDRGRLDGAEDLFRQAVARLASFGPDQEHFATLLQRQGKVADAADQYDLLMQYSHRYAPEFLQFSYDAAELPPRKPGGGHLDPSIVSPLEDAGNIVYWAHMYVWVPEKSSVVSFADLQARAGRNVLQRLFDKLRPGMLVNTSLDELKNSVAASNG